MNAIIALCKDVLLYCPWLMKTKREEESAKETPADHFWLKLSGPLLKFTNHQLQFNLNMWISDWVHRWMFRYMNPEILFVLFAAISKEEEEEVFKNLQSVHLHCESQMPYSWKGHFLLYPTASSFLCSLAWGCFFFYSDIFFFFFFFFTDFDLHSFQLFTYVGNSLGVHGDFLLQCRATVG